MPTQTEQPTRRKFAEGRKSQGGRIVFVSTAKTLDRDSEVVIPSGIQNLDAFAKNPALLWGHDDSALPIGRVEEYIVAPPAKSAEDMEENLFVPSFASHDFAQAVKSAVEEDVVNASSIRFIPKEIGEPIFDGQEGATIKTWDLLEQSLVSIPANAEALRRWVSDSRTISKFAKQFGFPELEGKGKIVSGPTKSKRVTRRKSAEEKPPARYQFETLDEVLAFAEKHAKHADRTAYTKGIEGSFEGETDTHGDEEKQHSHSLLVSLVKTESGDSEVSMGITSVAEDGHTHAIKRIGETEPGGEDNHVHTWGIEPEPEEEESTPEPKSAKSFAAEEADMIDLEDEADLLELIAEVADEAN